MKNLTLFLCLILLTVGCNEADKPEVIPAEEVPVEEVTEQLGEKNEKVIVVIIYNFNFIWK